MQGAIESESGDYDEAVAVSLGPNRSAAQVNNGQRKYELGWFFLRVASRRTRRA